MKKLLLTTSTILLLGLIQPLFGEDCCPEKNFEPTIESLKQYECPDWFRDAKFGIYMHWGAYSVAEQGEWYARNLYIEGSPSNLHHLENYGPQNEFGYKDFIPMFKAEKFDAVEWLDIFETAGVKYVVPVGMRSIWGRVAIWSAIWAKPCGS